MPNVTCPSATQYRDVLRNVLESGEWVPTRQGLTALTLMQQTMRFRLSDGFPLITERSLKGFWRKPIAELCAFINGVTSAATLAEFGCDWWFDWATPEKTRPKGIPPGELGPGSYGGAFRYFPTLEGPPFDQFQHLVEQICELPEDRTHLVSPWIPQYQTRGKGKTPRSTIAPCHGWVHVRVLNHRLHLHMFQRSGDLPVGVPANMIQYGALMLMLGQLTGYPVGTYYHTISDAHMYENQVPYVREMLKREVLPLPEVRLNSQGRSIHDIHDFRPDHFELTGYAPHPAMTGIPVAV
jgi:thymidylate synthase